MATGVTPPPYTRDILRLAASIPHLGRINDEDGAVELRSTTCGSRIRLGFTRQGDRLQDLAIEVEACAYGQAATCLMARHATDCDKGEARSALASISDWLNGESDDPGGWPGIEALEPGRARRGRHGAILLPFRALVEALEME